MILVVGSFRLAPGALDRAGPAMQRVIEASRAEPGCLAYAYALDTLDRGLIRVNEAWTDRASLTRHFDAAHMLTWRSEREALGLTERQMTAFEVGDGELL